jgi:hypothetical protein
LQQFPLLQPLVAYHFGRTKPKILTFSRLGLGPNRHDAIENIIEIDPVAILVREIMADRAQWTGSASDLLQVGSNRSGWPKSPRALAGQLRRAQTFPRTVGIKIVFGREGRLGTRTIMITVVSDSRWHNTVSTVSHVRDNGPGANHNHPPPGVEQAL